MLKHGFNYSELQEMSLKEIRFWAQSLSEYLETANDYDEV